MRSVWARMCDFAKDRYKLRRRFDAIVTDLVNREKYYKKFSSMMKMHCRNRFGNGRVSELYCAWRIKRRCLRQWLRCIAKSRSYSE
mmetsp:Transcript_24080/g.44714  ORF Transcript_24080/g.44714 Transcript_24080/m.44714 type:complete len:86 (-) Transcript_24080:112-369(-)